MNIEDEFLKFDCKDESFPASKNYLSIYNILKINFDTQIHPEIKTKILEIEKSGYYNDHGIDHIKMVVDRVSRLINQLTPTFLKSNSGFYISPYEIFILLVAINLHDAGHLIASRKEHARKGLELLSRFDKGDLLDSSEKKIIGEIAKSHGGKEDPIGRLPEELSVSHRTIRPQFLAALLRLGDELAEDKTRASTLLLRLKDQKKEDYSTVIEPTSEIFHRFSASLDSIDISGKEITLHFYIHEEQLSSLYPIVINKENKEKYLLDEIYARTMKTFTETLYCNRYFPETLRLNTVKVEIHLLTEYHEDIQEPIKFVLRESGYPMMQNEDIFELCKVSLTKPDGIKINGEYIHNLIKSKNEESI